eukprot:s89_g26.t1
MAKVLLPDGKVKELALERALSQFIMEEYPEELLELADPVPPQEESAAATAPEPTPARLPPTVAPPIAAAEPLGKLTLQLAPERRMTDSESWEQLWEQLRLRGWSIVSGPRGDRYWLPPGVKREWPWQNRKDYFDSKKQVIRHLRDQGHVVVEVASGSEPKAASKPPKAVKRKAPDAPAAVPPRGRVVRSKAASPAGPETPSAASHVKVAVRSGLAPPAPAAQPHPRANSKQYSDWEQLWQQLLQRGWRLEEVGKRRDAYFLPPGVQRGPGKKCRVDYFDSKKQVIEQLGVNMGDLGNRRIEDLPSERLLASAVAPMGGFYSDSYRGYGYIPTCGGL